MAQPQFFRGQVFIPRTRHWNRGRRRGTHDLERRRAHFDVARHELGIAHLLGSRDDLAFDEHDCLGAERCRRGGNLGRAVPRIEGHLHDSAAVTEIDKCEAAEIAAAMYPTTKANVLTDVLRTKRAGEVCTMSCREVVSGHDVGKVGALWLPRSREGRLNAR